MKITDDSVDAMHYASSDSSSLDQAVGNAYVLHARMLDGAASRRQRPSAFRFLGAITCAVGLCGIISCIILNHDGHPSQVLQFGRPEDTAAVSPLEMLSRATETSDRQPRSALFQMLAKLTTVYCIIYLRRTSFAL